MPYQFVGDLLYSKYCVVFVQFLALLHDRSLEWSERCVVTIFPEDNGNEYFPTVLVMRNDSVGDFNLDLEKYHPAPGTFLVLLLLIYACFDQKLTHCLYSY